MATNDHGFTKKPKGGFAKGNTASPQRKNKDCDSAPNLQTAIVSPAADYTTPEGFQINTAQNLRAAVYHCTKKIPMDLDAAAADVMVRCVCLARCLTLFFKTFLYTPVFVCRCRTLFRIYDAPIWT